MASPWRCASTAIVAPAAAGCASASANRIVSAAAKRETTAPHVEAHPAAGRCAMFRSSASLDVDGHLFLQCLQWPRDANTKLLPRIPDDGDACPPALIRPRPFRVSND